VKVGDLVVRAYAFHTFIPGIIVDSQTQELEFDGDSSGTFKYDEVSYVVAWSDGVMTSELDSELEYLEAALGR